MDSRDESTTARGPVYPSHQAERGTGWRFAAGHNRRHPSPVTAAGTGPPERQSAPPGGEGAAGPSNPFEKEPCSELGGPRKLKQTGCFPKNSSFIWFGHLFPKHVPTRRYLR